MVCDELVGRHVVVNERRLVRGRDDPVRELGGAERAVTIGADLALPADRDGLAERIEGLGVAVEVLVNNAGFGMFGSFVETGREAELRPN